MKKLFAKLKAHLPSKRRLIQLYAALLFNANIKGFFNGRIYKGPLKNLCAPGLNCYSCPGATGACPLGSLQNELGASGRRAPFYVIGILILYGVIFGRFICGFLCPFGLVQELLHKIKTPKLKKNRITRVLSYFKYVVLGVLTVLVPILYGIRNLPLPGFCKYICPAGTLEGALGLLSNKINESELARLGPLFTWKFALLVSFILGSVFIFRFFCRFFCPLGAIYGFFNKISLVGVKLDSSKCVECGLCHGKCGMDVRRVGDHECISCGECIDVCPTKAISWKGSKLFMAPNEVLTPEEAATMTAEALAERERELKQKREKVKKRNLIIKITAGVLMTALLVSALVYFNFIDKADEPAPPVSDSDGTDNSTDTPTADPRCDYDLPLFDENGLTGETFNPAKNTGKLTVVNFWGTWCAGCIKELPYFDMIASEYKEKVTVIAVHTVDDFDTAPDYLANPNIKPEGKESFIGSDMLFACDSKSDPEDRYSPDLYFTSLGGSDAYPITIVIDENGVIVKSIMDATTYDELKAVIEAELAE